MKRVFVDFHHSSLLKSLKYLFEDRLGWELYRPIGEQWFAYGFWEIYHNSATVKQYLSLDQAYLPQDGSPQLNQIQTDLGYAYLCKDVDGDLHKAVTFEGFKNMDFDIVIASVIQHIDPFNKLIKEHKPNAKFIFQAGNNWDLSDFSSEKVPNIMASANLTHPRSESNVVIYHQEFDTAKYFNRVINNPGPLIYSFVNCFSESSDYKLFLKLEKELDTFVFKSFGGQCRDGSMTGHLELANKMREARFIIHLKPGGDGYGHILFNSASLGKPLIIKKGHYKGQLAEKLLIDDVTCINIDGLTIEEIKNKIEYFSEPERYQIMSDNVYNNFKATVNFDEDFEKIKTFLENLK